MKSLNLAISEGQRINGLMSLGDAGALIEAGASLSIAGRAEALARLPKGRWIGGTTPYFMTDHGGCIVGAEQVFVTDFSGLGSVSTAIYDEHNMEMITTEAPENGFALAIIPFQSKCHERFAKEAGSYPLAFLRPTVGWIAGFDLNEAGASALVFDGISGEAHANKVAVLHIDLPTEALPLVEIVNLFSADGVEEFHFEESSFSPKYVVVNGQRQLFADYVRARGREDASLPLVGDYSGARINASLRCIDGDVVHLYAPVFPDVSYSFAGPVTNFVSTFRETLANQPHDGSLWSCNCILNYLFGELQGQVIGGCAGPVTFGEIAYQLVNQTLVEVRCV